MCGEVGVGDVGSAKEVYGFSEKGFWCSGKVDADQTEVLESAAFCDGGKNGGTLLWIQSSFGEINSGYLGDRFGQEFCIYFAQIDADKAEVNQ